MPSRTNQKATARLHHFLIGADGFGNIGCNIQQDFGEEKMVLNTNHLNLRLGLASGNKAIAGVVMTLVNEGVFIPTLPWNHYYGLESKGISRVSLGAKCTSG